MRPAELAHDETPHLPVIQHAARWMHEHASYQPDAVMILQPTSPLRTRGGHRRRRGAARHVRRRFGAQRERSAGALRIRCACCASTTPATPRCSPPASRCARRINRRQDLPPAWVMNGAIYACRTRVLFAAEPSLYGDRVVAYRMPAERSISIDDLEDWAAAERALQRRA